MATQIVDYHVGIDTGDADPTSIGPVLDGEDANQVTFQRPSENLRLRTEVIRREIEELLYLRDATQVLLTGGGIIHWNGTVAAGGDGRFTITEDLALRPFLAPVACTPGAVNVNGVDFRAATTASAGVNPARSYGQMGSSDHPGANKITVETIAVPGAANLSAAVSSPPGPRHISVNFNPNTHTLANLVDFINASTDPGAVSVRALGLAAALHEGAQGATLLTPFPRTYMLGAADAELHLVSAIALASFFSAPESAMSDGDVLAIWYDALVVPSGGGRRQSIAEGPENSAAVPAESLFLVHRYPERIPGALPIARVVDGDLIFTNLERYVQGVDGPSASVSAIDLPASGHVQVGALTDAGSRVDTAGGQGQVTLSRAGEAPAVLTKTSLSILVGGSTNADSLHTHSAKAITSTPPAGFTSTNVQDALTEVATQLAGKAPLVHTHVPSDIVGDFPAARVATTPAGNLVATNVQAAVDELDATKAGLALANTFSAQQVMPAGITQLPEPGGPTEPATKGYSDGGDAKTLASAMASINGLPGQPLTWTAAQLFQAGFTVSALATFAQLVANGEVQFKGNLDLIADGDQVIGKSGNGVLTLATAAGDIYIVTAGSNRWLFSRNGQLVSFGGGIAGLPSPTQPGDAASKSYVDALPSRAQTWTASQTFDQAHKITGLPAPSVASDAVPKSYVDALKAVTLSVTISGTNTGLTIAPGSGGQTWPTNYKIFYNFVSSTGTPPDNAFNVRFITKNTNQFNITLMAAPGAGNSVTFDVALMP
jgi:hypothetical protein